MLKQMDPTKITLGEVEYAIYPFSAFDAAEVSGDLAKFISPLVAGILPLLGDDTGNGDDDRNDDRIEALLNTDLSKAMPIFMQALSTFDGKTIRTILMKLLVSYRNIACEYREEDGRMVQCYLTEDVANRLFTGGLEDMIMLALEVCKLNFSGFFTKLRTRYGSPSGPGNVSNTASMAPLTPGDLTILS